MSAVAIQIICNIMKTYLDDYVKNKIKKKIKKIKELSERAHIPHAPHIDRRNAKFLK
jgi:hypothetical protein